MSDAGADGDTAADGGDVATDTRSVDQLLHKVRFGQFLSVGAVGAGLETVIVALLTAGYAVDPLAAKAVGAEASITLMFLINDTWTFADEGGSGVVAGVRRWGKSHMVRLVGVGVAFGVLTLLTKFTDVRLLLAGADFWPTVANLAGIGCGLLVNYVFESLFTWRVAAE